ncbi:uncharacterized protein LOC133321260 [Musca vetustissima]|uniref:uncharacterized protein LOC133321260 n=1 Tax=Musca vetustissima TaxID=27455 RepID=UPI002AB684F3|nr:uncharacterized protein LOC133321260 [Musca vetustissima]
MGRGKHCSAEKRELIRKLISEGKSYREVGRLLECSNKMIRNAIQFKEKPETRGRKRVISYLLTKRLFRQAKKEPFKPATELKKELNIPATVQTVRHYLRINGLKSCSPRKVPLLSAKHVAKRITFAKEHSNWPLEKWRNILWTDENYEMPLSWVFQQDNDPKHTSKKAKKCLRTIMYTLCSGQRSRQTLTQPRIYGLT